MNHVNIYFLVNRLQLVYTHNVSYLLVLVLCFPILPKFIYTRLTNTETNKQTTIILSDRNYDYNCDFFFHVHFKYTGGGECL